MNFKILRIGVLLVLLGAFAEGKAYAGDFFDRLSGNFGIGAYSATSLQDSEDADGNTIRRSSGAGYLASIGVSYRISDHFSDNLNFTYSWHTYTAERYDSTGTRIGFTENNGANQYSLVDTVQVNILPKSPFDIYFKAGPGLHFTNTGGDTEEDTQATEATFGVSGGGGVIIRVSSLTVVLDAQIHYYDVSDTERSALSFGIGGGF